MYLENKSINIAVSHLLGSVLKMTREVKAHAHLLQALLKVSRKQRLAILKEADKQLVKCICECSLNLLKGRVPLKSEEKKKLSTYKVLLRNLALRKGGWKSKKKILLQKGGNFIPLLLGPILSAVLSSALS